MSKRVHPMAGTGQRIADLVCALGPRGAQTTQYEFADLLGIKRGTLNAWIVRGNFPGRVEFGAYLAKLPLVVSRGLDSDALARWAEDGKGDLTTLLRSRRSEPAPGDTPPIAPLAAPLLPGETCPHCLRDDGPNELKMLDGLIADLKRGRITAQVARDVFEQIAKSLEGTSPGRTAARVAIGTAMVGMLAASPYQVEASGSKEASGSGRSTATTTIRSDSLPRQDSNLKSGDHNSNSPDHGTGYTAGVLRDLFERLISTILLISASVAA